MKTKTRIEKFVDRHYGKIMFVCSGVIIVGTTYLYMSYKGLSLLRLTNRTATFLKAGGVAIFTIDGVDYALKLSDV